MSRSSLSTAIDAISITPSDSAGLSKQVRALYVGGSGNVVLVTPENTQITFSSVQTGSVIPVQAIRVLSTGTTATNIVGLI